MSHHSWPCAGPDFLIVARTIWILLGENLFESSLGEGGWHRDLHPANETNRQRGGEFTRWG
jgi:hypothetical protein